jgi:hypothetical protein
MQLRYMLLIIHKRRFIHQTSLRQRSGNLVDHHQGVIGGRSISGGFIKVVGLVCLPIVGDWPRSWGRDAGICRGRYGRVDL